MTVALANPVMSQPAGWQARLSLEFVRRDAQARTVAAGIEHEGPLRVQRPFYPEGDICHVYVLHPPGGVVGGDGLQQRARCHPEARALVTTPGATKFYRSAGGTATVRQGLEVGSGACLEWLPQENIFFPGARVDVATDIHLHNHACFIGWEINCLGRSVINEVFTGGQLHARTRLFVGGRPLLVESQCIGTPRHLSAPAGLRDHAVQGLMLAWKVDPALVDAIQSRLPECGEERVGATLLDGLLVVRVLGNNAERVRALLSDVWTQVRPMLLDTPALAPRIWAT